MRSWSATILGCLAAASVQAQEAPRQSTLDSGAVVRLRWSEGREKALLLAPLGPGSNMVRYCRYPSPVCGEATHNPPRSRPTADLLNLDVRRGSRAKRGALIGAGVGALGGLIVLLGEAFGDSPARSTSNQLFLIVGLAGVWSGLGALVGSASDNWQPVQ